MNKYKKINNGRKSETFGKMEVAWFKPLEIFTSALRSYLQPGNNRADDVIRSVGW